MRKPLALLTLISMMFAAPVSRADDHMVTRRQLDQRLADAATERARNLASVDGFLSSPRAGKAAAIAGIDLGQVRSSLPRLSDRDLRDLSRRAAALGSDPVAGHYGDAEDALVFVIVIAAAALVLIAVADRI
jgi:hypothetical protein